VIRRIIAELIDGRTLVVSVEPPSVIDTTAEPLDDEPSGVRPALAKCAPEPRLTTARQMRGHLRRVA
jgi:hypothetical protein